MRSFFAKEMILDSVRKSRESIIDEAARLFQGGGRGYCRDCDAF